MLAPQRPAAAGPCKPPAGECVAGSSGSDEHQQAAVGGGETDSIESSGVCTSCPTCDVEQRGRDKSTSNSAAGHHSWCTEGTEN